MPLAAARTTQPMSVPWITARRGHPARLLVTLERRVTLLIEDGLMPVADLHARVFATELIALLTVEHDDGSPLEQRRVRAHDTDAERFADAVVEQVELACHLCPGITVAVTRDDAAVWQPLRDRLGALIVEGARVPVQAVVDRSPLASEDLELTRRRRRALGTPPPRFRPPR